MIELKVGFNSKVVRLKVRQTQEAREAAKQFQFQSGAVKRLTYDYDRRPMNRFQFQSGAVKSDQ